MKNTIMAVALTIGCSVVGFAQSTTNTATGQASNEASTSANQAGRSINLQSGTQLQGELQKSIDVRKAKVGDQVLLRTKKAIKSEGQTIVPKGARLLGHVTEVQKKSDASNSSRIGIVFDRLESGSLAVPIMATITSITRGSASAQANNDLFGSDASGSMGSRTSAQRSTSSGGGGLLGGVTNTAGSVVNSTTATTGQVVGATTGAVGSTVSSTTSGTGETVAGSGSVGRIQISQSSSTSAAGSSVLSLQRDNLKLEKGTTFHLTLSQSSSVKTDGDNK